MGRRKLISLTETKFLHLIVSLCDVSSVGMVGTYEVLATTDMRLGSCHVGLGASLAA